jgi:imidazolonepropionase
LTLRGSQEARRGSELNQLSIIPDGSLLVRDGVLEQVGTTRRVENLAAARGAIEVSAVGCVVMPAFVDSHTHLLAPPPGTQPLEAITGMRLVARARALLEAMVRHGTATIEIKTGCGPDESAELKILRAAAKLRGELVDVVPSVLFRRKTAGDNGAMDQMCERLLPKIRRRKLACFADIECEDRADCLRYLATARSLGFGVKIHAAHATPSAAIAAGVESGAVTIDHLECATGEDVAPLGASKTIATVLPSKSFYGDGRAAPARALIDAGAAVALASNFNSHHTPTLSMQTVVALACRYLQMTPAEAITAATINGAHALGWGHRLGSLQYGKAADVLILNISDYRDMAQVLGTGLVRLTMKNGRVVYREGQVAPRPVEPLRSRGDYVLR